MDLETAKKLQESAFSSLISDGVPFSGDNQKTSQTIGNGVGVVVDEHSECKLNIHISHLWDKWHIRNKLKNIKDLNVDQDIIFRLTSQGRPLYAQYRGLRIAHQKTWEKKKSKYGTLGGIVKNIHDDNLSILSCHHVLANVNQPKIDDLIVYLKENTQSYKPKNIRLFNIFNNCISQNNYEPIQIGCLSQYNDIKYPPHRNYMDAAIAETVSLDTINPNPNINLPKFLPKFQGVRDSHFINTQLTKKEVSKLGAKTGMTKGIVLDVLGSHKINYDGKTAIFDNVISIGTADKGKSFAKPGDSGSIIYDNHNYAVGLLFAGSENTTYAIPIETVLHHFKVALA